MKTRLASVLGALAIASVFALPASATPMSPTYIPGSVSASLSSNGDYASGRGVANGFYPGYITVHVELYMGSSSSGPWGTPVWEGGNACSNSTSCEKGTPTEDCTKAYVRIVVTGSGPGGAAENNPATKTKLC